MRTRILAKISQIYGPAGALRYSSNNAIASSIFPLAISATRRIGPRWGLAKDRVRDNATLVLLSLLRPVLCGETGLSADELQLRETAQQCSETALRRYALSSAEPAEKVAEAAFDKCKEPWNRFAEALGRKIEASAKSMEAQKNCVKYRGLSAHECSQTGMTSFYLFGSERQRFIHDASTEVFDIRAEAAGK
jgi:hypothetical protein